MTDIKLTCPSCSQKIEAPGELAGQLTECPTCRQTLEVPFRSIRSVDAQSSFPLAESHQSGEGSLHRHPTIFSRFGGLLKSAGELKNRALRKRRFLWLRDTTILWVVIMSATIIVFWLHGDFDLSGIEGVKWWRLTKIMVRFIRGHGVWIPLAALLVSMAVTAFVRFRFDSDPGESDA